MDRRYQVLLEWDPDETVWVTYVPALDRLSTFGDTREAALANTREAVLGYLEAAEIEGIPVPGDHALELVQLDVAI